MTDLLATRHSEREGAPEAGLAMTVLEFDEIYEAHFDFVWRCARRLGALDSMIDDIVQETFMIAHRRLREFEGRSSVRTWLYGIARRVAANHRRSISRRGESEELGENTIVSIAPTPETAMENTEAVELIQRLLNEMSDEHRDVFILAELEQMSAPAIATAVGTNVNTVYSRLRAARSNFNVSLNRHRAQIAWRAS